MAKNDEGATGSIMSLIDEQLMIESGYRKYIDHLRVDAILYKKEFMDGDGLSYVINVFEYDFSKFAHRGYNGPEYRHDVEMSFQQEDGIWVKIIFSLEPHHTLAWIEDKCKRFFDDNQGYTVEYTKEEETE